jgi:hypothetical protein
MPKPSRVESVAAVLLGGSHGLHPGVARFWPAANNLEKADRLAVIRATHHGENIGDARLAPGVIEYSRALNQAVRGRLFRHLAYYALMPCVVAAYMVMVHAAPSVPGIMGGITATVIVVVASELRWGQLLSNAQRADAWARLLLEQHSADSDRAVS